MSRRCRIVVVGGGIAGLATAAMLASLQRRELEVCVVDRGPAPQRTEGIDLRVSAIAEGSARALERIGAWPPALASRAGAMETMRVWDAQDSPHSDNALQFDAAEFALPALAYVIDNMSVRAALAAAAEARGVLLRFGTGTSMRALEDGRIDLQSDGGGAIDVDLLVAADGADSPLRDAASIGISEQTYPQAAFVTHLRPERPHRSCALQRFLPDGPMGILPLADGRVSVVWSTTPEKADAAMQASDDLLAEMLTVASDAVLGRLEPAAPRGVFALRALHSRSYVRAGLALVGDAAHTVHPLAGQGANLGLRDAAALAATIDAALEAGEFPADRPVLRRYERARRGENALMLNFMTGLDRLFRSDSALLGELRRSGMRLFNGSGPLRRHVAAVALGTAGGSGEPL